MGMGNGHEFEEPEGGVRDRFKFVLVSSCEAILSPLGTPATMWSIVLALDDG
jgi:hypothetical protein